MPIHAAEKNTAYLYKAADAGNRELFSMIIYRPAARFLLLGIFRHSGITPNQVSLLSLAVLIAASLFFASGDYFSMIIGVCLLHLTYTFDMLDGQLARYKGLSSKFGKWLDPFLDSIKLVFLYASLSFAAFLNTKSPFAFFWGMPALANSLLTFYILNTRSQIIKTASFEVNLGNKIYVGYEISLYWTITVFVLLGKVFWGLVFLGTVGALAWIKTFITLYLYYRKNRQQIESG